MNRLRRWTKNLFDILAFGFAAFLIMALVSTMLFSAYAGLYVMNNLDRGLDEIIRVTSKLEGIATKLDGHGENLVKKSTRIENKLNAPGGKGLGGEMMPEIADLKLLLLEILENAVSAGDVQATQQMGINLSNAVKREGVVIIQNQNVEVLTRIMPSMVKAIKFCDAIESSTHYQPVIEMQPQQQQLPPPAMEEVDPIEACCAWLYQQGTMWQGAQDLMKSRYLAYVIDQSATKKEAARKLGIGSTYLSKLTKINDGSDNE